MGEVREYDRVKTVSFFRVTFKRYITFEYHHHEGLCLYGITLFPIWWSPSRWLALPKRFWE